MNKKILAVLMALMMVLTSVAAFAEGETTTEQVVEEETSFTLNKTYLGDGRDAETFTFELSNAEGNDGPILTFADDKNTLSFAADNIASNDDNNDSQSLTINVPAVGGTNGYAAAPATYEYILKEIPGQNADIEYDGTIWNVKVTVYNAAAEGEAPTYKTTLSIKKNGTKNDSADFKNTFEAGNTLTVTKKVTGNMADSADTFTIQVTITDASGATLALATAIGYTPSDESITVTDKGNGVYEITGIGHDGSVTFTNLPQGAKYDVVETDTKNYTVAYDRNKTKTVTKNEDINTVVTNDKSDTIDTGVTTDSMPYIMLMAFVMILAAAVVLKKRSVNE